MSSSKPSKNKNNNKSIDKLSDKLDSFERRYALSKEKETEAHIQTRFAKLRAGRKARGEDPQAYSDEEKAYYHKINVEYDPRLRYKNNRYEPMMHPSSIPSPTGTCDCEGCKNEIDGCINGCNAERCVTTCPYIPTEGLETIDHKIAYEGTEDYDMLLEQWLVLRRRHQQQQQLTRRKEV
jgi:hypothetical protein